VRPDVGVRNSRPPMVESTLTVGLALFFGMIAQLVAVRLRVPAIVLLLAAGVGLGPEGFGWIRPARMGEALLPVVGLAVSIVLFEGAMALDVRRLRDRGPVVRRLVIWGGLVSVLGGALAAALLMGFGWRVSLLFGTLVMVTGPTVIRPLLKRVPVRRSVHEVLEAEGIFIDAFGTVCVVVALRLATIGTKETVFDGLVTLLSQVGVGLAVGLAAGALLIAALRKRGRIPEELKAPFLLSVVVASWVTSNSLANESGVIAVIAAGLLVGNARLHSREELLHFKERLTPLLLGMLFVLLAADVSLEDVVALGTGGLLVVALLMFLVRPLAVWLTTQGGGLTHAERGFVAWLGPRGIMAAALASLSALELEAHGAWEGGALRALVFLVIAMTVTVQGMTAGPVAKLLGVVREQPRGYVLFGGNALARLVGRALRATGAPVLMLVEKDESVHAAQADGFPVVYGDALAERTLARTRPERRHAFVALSADPQRNLLWAGRVARSLPQSVRLVAVDRGGERGDPVQTVRESGALALFGGARRVSQWIDRAEAGRLSISFLRLQESEGLEVLPGKGECAAQIAPLLVWREGRLRLADDEWSPRTGDVCGFLIDQDAASEATAWLLEHGWTPAGPMSPDGPRRPMPAAEPQASTG